MKKDEISTKTETWRKRSKKKIEVEEKKEKKNYLGMKTEIQLNLALTELCS